ncbi:hypothetical protein G5V57_04405 [Nordella sp. HKS 07]|uniref:hypothetical protein n=1 Tax=Nordella sp. HKS 07 TaxID=2712222 RepID=UPI0013E138E0|nr:hypothetical protein [Nordella sp. HKS 07]QIG47054.1 hypothetical protein G5V57_04405 [Nordella sp. HKS 07]
MSKNLCLHGSRKVKSKFAFWALVRTTTTMKYASFIAAVASILLISPADAASESFFDNLAGNWTGSGKAYVKIYGEISARCRVSIRGTEVVIIMSGSCGMLVFRQPLGFSLRKAGNNRYVGTYTGSKTGPAKLEGTLRGNRLVMTIRWGGLVNGDRTAQMVLERTGPNSFAETVNDSVAGTNRNTANFAFVRE